MTSVAKRSGVTILDVAERAGVSVSTVSRVLNERSDVSSATRRRVQAAIADLDFSPVGRPPVTRPRRVISMLFPVSLTAHAGFDLDFIVGAASAASERGFAFNLVTGELPAEQLTRLCRSGDLSAAILAQVTLDDWRLPILEQFGIPFVTIGRPSTVERLSFADFDSEGAVVAMFDYLVGLGHRRIAFIGWPRWPIEAGFGPAIRHHAGYEQVMGRLDLPRILIQTDPDSLAVSQAITHLLTTREPPTAIVTTNRIAASAALRTVQEHGLAVPGDLSVIGICADWFAETLSPRLTNVRFPSAELGHQAASMLVRRLQATAVSRPEHVIIAPQITVRGTSGRQKAEG